MFAQAATPRASGPRICPCCGTVYPWAVWTCGRDGARLVQRTAGAVGQQLDHYRLVEEIGQGGCGRIFRAIPTFVEQPVALKVLNTGADDNQARRFRREAQAMRRVRHPNVVAVLDYGTTRDGCDFLVMELVRGRTLSAELREHGPMQPARAARLMREIARALHAVHEAGLVHRDLKPDNVMITGAASEERVKLIDFGVACDLTAPPTEQLTAAGHVSGTPRYMSPESFDGHAPDVRRDLYALGVTLYELLTGAPPFEGSVGQLVARHLTTTPAPLPGEIGALALALMAKDPAARPPSAQAVIARLDRIIARETHAPVWSRLRALDMRAPLERVTRASVRAWGGAAARTETHDSVYA